MDIIRLLAIILLVLVLCYSAREHFTVHAFKEDKIDVWTLKKEDLGRAGEDHIVTFVKSPELCKKKLLKKRKFKSAAIKLKPNKRGEHQCILMNVEAHKAVDIEAHTDIGYSIMAKEQGEVYPMSVLRGVDTLEVIDGVKGKKGRRACRKKCMDTPECTASVSLRDKCILKKGEARPNDIMDGEIFLNSKSPDEEEYPDE